MKLRTLNEAAEALNLTRRQLRMGIESGRYPALSWGNRLLIDLDEIAPIVAQERQQRERHEGMIGLRECADAIGISQDALRRMALSGLVPYERSGRYYRFRLAAVEEAIRAGMQTGPNKPE